MGNIKTKVYDPIKGAFLLTILYWAYLIFTSRMYIVFDAINYEQLGRVLVQQGWVEFFKTGPQREPFYPALIAFSMGLGKISGISYQFIQVVLQFAILFLTQILTLRILRILKINKLISAFTIIYLGISPAIVNSALSLFSEIAAYPIILAIMLLIHESWLAFSGKRKRVILLAILTGFLFVLMVLNKGIFELVTPVFLFMFLISAFCTHNRKLIINAVIYLMVILSVFYLLISGYKSANVVFNGHFTITDRGAWALYGSTARRTQPLSKERFLTALAYVPGEGVCNSVFGEEKCRFWSFEKVDEFGYQKINELNNKNIPPGTVDKTLIKLAKQEIQQKPAQYAVLFVLEGLKMFFWESTQVCFVEYPEWLGKFFAWGPLKNGLRLVMALLTVLSFIYLIVQLWRRRKNFLTTENPELFLYFCLLLILSFIYCYSIFSIITRYLFPVAPLYLIIIAYFFQKICFRASNPE